MDFNYKKLDKTIHINEKSHQEILEYNNFIKTYIWDIICFDNKVFLDTNEYVWKSFILGLKDAYLKNDNSFLSDISKLALNNNFFRININHYISNSLKNFLNSDWINIYSELSFYFFLLSWCKDDLIFKDIETIDFIRLQWLFTRYENEFIDSFNNKSFNTWIVFQTYSNLLEAINKIGAFYTFDTARKELIFDLINISSSSIENIEKWLSENEDFRDNYFSSKLNFYKWKYLLNFSHIEYIDVWKLDLSTTLKKFYNIFLNQTKWYDLVINSLSNEEEKEFFRGIYIWNVSYILSIMFKKLSYFTKDDIVNNINFKLIFDKYIDKVSLNDIEYDFFEFKDSLVDNFHKLYNINNSIDLWTSTIWNTEKIITEFIGSDKNFNEFQIESIHHILLFSDKLNLLLLLKLANKIISDWKYNNYNFEFFKIKTLLVIVSRVTDYDVNDSELIKRFFLRLENYIEENMTASQLLSSYSKIYLLFARFYSKSEYRDDLDIAKEYTIKYLWSHWKLCDLSDWNWNIYNEIQENIWALTDKNFWVTWTKWWFEIKKYEELHELKEEIYINNKFSKFLHEAFSNDWRSIWEVTTEMSKVISTKLFHGICNVFIDWPDINNRDFKVLIHNRWYIKKSINIIDWYNLIFYYPTNFDGIFCETYAIKENFINLKLKALIKAYLQKKSDEIDKLTWLYNYNKLNSILDNIKDESFTFINIKLWIVKNFNNAYWYSQWDHILRSFSALLKENNLINWELFRLSGVQIGILLNDNSNLQSIIDFINNSSVKINDTLVKVNPFIWVVDNHNKNILEKSNMALSIAREKWDKIFYYDDSYNSSESNKENIYYLSELEKAIENNRLIPFFQPIVSSLPWHEVVKYECLLRVEDSSGKINSPFKFLNAANSVWKLKDITYIMIDKVFYFATLNNAGFSINLWSEDLNINTLNYISDTLDKYSLKWQESRFTFEILESDWRWWEDFLKIIKELKNRWFIIAMDDFWSDSSNLNRYLDLVKSNSIDILKLDMWIIKALLDSEGREVRSTSSLIQWIVSSAHDNWVKVVAEYVENETLAFYLSRLHIDYFQWYYFWKPSHDLNILK